MIKNIKPYIIRDTQSIYEALAKINSLGKQLTLFVCDSKDKICGSITDGDIRRALLKGYSLKEAVEKIMNKNFTFFKANLINPEEFSIARSEGKKMIPVINSQKKITGIIDTAETKSVLPVTAVIMAGGKGERLRPLTSTVPKPMLQIGKKPILEHNIDWIAKHGIETIYISVNYLGQQIINYFKNGRKKKLNIKYITEKKPMGTIGAIAKIKNEIKTDILLLNSDLLTNIELDKFYLHFHNSKSYASIATIPHSVSIPFAILSLQKKSVTDILEKPVFDYQANAGIYLFKKQCLKYIPKDTPFNATDLIDKLIKFKKPVTSFLITGYWLDIGSKEDYQKAKEHIKFLKF